MVGKTNRATGAAGAGHPTEAETWAERDELVDRLLEASMQVFGSRGYRGASLNDIVEQCGISKPTLYRFFRSKAELYEAVVLRVHRRFMEGVRRAMAEKTTLKEKLTAYLEYQFDFAVRHVHLLKTLHSVMFLPEEVRPQINHALIAEERFGVLLEVLRPEAEKGRLRGDPVDVALAVAGLGSIGVVQALLPSMPILQKGLAARLCDLLFRGIAAETQEGGDSDA